MADEKTIDKQQAVVLAYIEQRERSLLGKAERHVAALIDNATHLRHAVAAGSGDLLNIAWYARANNPELACELEALHELRHLVRSLTEVRG